MIPGLPEVVEATTGVKWSDVKSPSRRSDVALVRHLVCYGAKMAGWGYSQTGRHFDRDHTSIMSACKTADGVCSYNQRAYLFALAVRHALLKGDLSHPGFDRKGVPFLRQAPSPYVIADCHAENISNQLEVSLLSPTVKRHLEREKLCGVSTDTCLKHWPFKDRPSYSAVRSVLGR